MDKVAVHHALGVVVQDTRSVLGVDFHAVFLVHARADAGVVGAMGCESSCLLDNSDLGPGGRSGLSGRGSGYAGANDNDIEVLGFGDVLNGGRRHFPRVLPRAFGCTGGGQLALCCLLSLRGAASSQSRDAGAGAGHKSAFQE